MFVLCVLLVVWNDDISFDKVPFLKTHIVAFLPVCTQFGYLCLACGCLQELDFIELFAGSAMLSHEARVSGLKAASLDIDKCPRGMDILRPAGFASLILCILSYCTCMHVSHTSCCYHAYYVQRISILSN